jgi:hypothetical protein
MPPTLTPATHRASFAIGDEQAAKRVVDALTEIFLEDQATIAAYERPDGRWAITVHFAEPPDQASVREFVGIAAGDEAARGVAFDTVEAKDWVKASLEDLAPVPAGRFVVHGRHDRARVPANKLAIEIEAALAFGTGHHGTTRGCLSACWRATSIRCRCGSRARTPGSTKPATWCRRSSPPVFRRRNFRKRGRSIWCWRTSSPIHCGNWQRRWRGISPRRRW